MRRMERLEPSSTVLMVVDLQERLAPAMEATAFGNVLRATELLLHAAELLGVRVLFTEQYPKGLGPTIPEIASKASEAGARILPKATFDALGDPDVRAAVLGATVHEIPGDVVVVGMEAHVCVYQTARSLVNVGARTHVVSDAVSSRTDTNRLLGLSMVERAGAYVTGTETVLFDWLERAGTDAFKQLSKLIK